LLVKTANQVSRHVEYGHVCTPFEKSK